jgi:hypothetical protein
MRRAALLAFVLFTACGRTIYCVLPPVDDPTFETKLVESQKESEPTQPTVDRPIFGCIAPTLGQQSHVEGKLMPEIVRVIGRYDELQVKVLRAGVFDPEKWVPMPSASVRFVGCGREIDAYRQVSAETSAPPRW